MIALNWSGLVISDWAVMVAFSSWPGGEGRPPTWPPVTWTFCASTALLTSAGISA